MTVFHSTLVDSERHEPKGASTAILGNVLTSTGTGTTGFLPIDYNNLTNLPISTGYTKEIVGRSVATSQAPTVADTTMLIEFGPVVSNTNVSLSVLGVLSFLKAGQYIVSIQLNIGRLSVAGNAKIFTRLMSNTGQMGETGAFMLPTSNVLFPDTRTFLINASIGDTLQAELTVDSTGVLDGGLYSSTVTNPSWVSTSCAEIEVYRFIGV